MTESERKNHLALDTKPNYIGFVVKKEDSVLSHICCNSLLQEDGDPLQTPVGLDPSPSHVLVMGPTIPKPESHEYVAMVA